ncbi:hypothetical protein [Allomuricauda sp. d1]|uniref:HYC_CC_PP family protein n=1 Tax=Allomuricauda sp. d1 TaxID=3136725 RepID=UPI0031CEDA35
MKKIIHQISSSLLALLVLLSTVSWSVDKHLCMGRVMDVAFFSHAEDCGMEASMMAFGETENHCCDDESFTLEGQDDLKLTFNDLEIDQQVFLAAFASSYLDLFTDFSEQTVPFDTYPPPLLVQDFNILYEVYLI